MSDDRVERRLAAVMAADVAGYSRLMGADEVGTLASLKTHRREVVDPTIAQHHGRIVKTTGDGMLVEFGSAVDAVTCAAAVQNKMAERNADNAQQIMFRIGINVGDIIIDENDIFGDGVNVAARVENECEPGGVYLSGSAFEQVRGKTKFQFDDLGEKSLKNIEHPVRLYAARFATGKCADSVDGSSVRPRSVVMALSQVDKPSIAQTRQRLGQFGAIIASVAALGAVISGLAGYWRTWDILNGHVVERSPVTVPSAGLIISKGPSVAVLPIANPAKATMLDPLADIMTQQLVSSLGKFSTLRVTPRATTANFLKQDDVSEAARKAGVDYLVTGEVRPLGHGARVNIQVADLRGGAEIWSRSFDASAEGVKTETDAYEIGDIAAAQIGGYPGAIAIADYKKIQGKATAELNSYECIVYAIVGPALGSSSAGLRALECTNRLTGSEPHNAQAWAARSAVLFNQRFLGFGLEPDQVQHFEKRSHLNEEILRAATRGIELAPDDAYMRRTFAQAVSTKCQIDLLRQETQKAITLNPNDPGLGNLGNYVAFMGDWDEGAAIAGKAIRLAGPNASFGWWFAPAKRHWWRGEYQAASEDFRHAYLEGFWLSHLDQAYTLPSLGRVDEAKAQVAKLLKLRPDFTIREADAFYRVYCFAPEYIERMNGALRQAGLPE